MGIKGNYKFAFNALSLHIHKLIPPIESKRFLLPTSKRKLFSFTQAEYSTVHVGAQVRPERESTCTQ